MKISMYTGHVDWVAIDPNPRIVTAGPKQRTYDKCLCPNNSTRIRVYSKAFMVGNDLTNTITGFYHRRSHRPQQLPLPRGTHFRR